MTSSCLCFACVDTSERGVVQQFGKFSHLALPGLSFLCWPFQTITAITTKVQQLDVKTSTKTKDNVTVIITTAVQYAVDEKKVEDFFFKLNEPSRQIAAHVENVVRSQIPKMDLDTAFLAKDDLAMAVKDDLSKSMQPYGLRIYGCLMTDMLADSSVLRAMNEINAGIDSFLMHMRETLPERLIVFPIRSARPARRQREANIEKAEAEKVLLSPARFGPPHFPTHLPPPNPNSHRIPRPDRASTHSTLQPSRLEIGSRVAPPG